MRITVNSFERFVDRSDKPTVETDTALGRGLMIQQIETQS